MKEQEITMTIGHVLIKPHRKGADGEIKIGDTSIYIPGGYERKHRLMNVIGEVIHSGGPIQKHKSGGVEWRAANVSLRRGDIVWYSWQAQSEAYDIIDGTPGRVITVEDIGECIIANYSAVICVLRKERVAEFVPKSEGNWRLLEMVNGWCLGKAIIKEAPKTTLLLPEMSRKGTIDTRMVTLVQMGADNLDYFARDQSRLRCYPNDGDVPVSIGDMLLLENACDIPLEGDYGKMIGDGEFPLYRFQKRNVMGVGMADVQAWESKENGQDLREGIDKDDWTKDQAFKKNLGKRDFHI